MEKCHPNNISRNKNSRIQLSRIQTNTKPPQILFLVNTEITSPHTVNTTVIIRRRNKTDPRDWGLGLGCCCLCLLCPRARGSDETFSAHGPAPAPAPELRGTPGLGLGLSSPVQFSFISLNLNNTQQHTENKADFCQLEKKLRDVFYLYNLDLWPGFITLLYPQKRSRKSHKLKEVICEVRGTPLY